jgi:hypothetical protein
LSIWLWLVVVGVVLKVVVAVAQVVLELELGFLSRLVLITQLRLAAVGLGKHPQQMELTGLLLFLALSHLLVVVAGVVMGQQQMVRMVAPVVVALYQHR